MHLTHQKTAGDEIPHRGITMHQMPVGGGFLGFLFAVGSALIFLLAIPALWFVVAAAAVVGIALAGVLQMFHRLRPDETARLTLKL